MNENTAVLTDKTLDNSVKVTNYIITHKAFQKPEDSSYVPLQVGFAPDLGYLRDNTGDQISEKNKNWCELTGLYWIWKNDSESDIVSINHYRRYFDYKGHLLTPEEETELLKTYDVIIAEFEPYKESVYKQFTNESGFAKDLDRLREIIEERDPGYLSAFDAVMKQGGLSQYNMMICKKDLYDEYCQWLFPILTELEKDVDLAQYNDYQKRIYGFLSERLLNVWVKARKLKVLTLPINQTEMSKSETRRLRIRRIRNRIQYSLGRMAEGNDKDK